MKYYFYESYPTESSTGGTLLYISNHLSYKIRSDLCIHTSKELESIFTGVLNPKKKNVIVGCIYRHLHMDVNEFKSYYVNNLLDKLSKENKTIFLLGNFNIDLLNYDQHSPANEFLDSLSLSLHMLRPPIVPPKRIRNNIG